MNKAAAVVAVAALSVGAALGGAPAQSAQTQPSANMQALAKRFMHAVCPVNRQTIKVGQEWEAAGFGKHEPAVGTPVPQDLRLAFRRTAQTSGHAAKLFRNGHWPQSLVDEAQALTEFYVLLQPFYRSRDTRTVRPSWVKMNTMPKVGADAIEMRRQLGLPPRGQGCIGLG